MKTSMLDSKTRDVRMEKDAKGQYLRIMEKFKSVDAKFDEMDLEKTEKIYEITKRSQDDQRKFKTQFMEELSELKTIS